ncbi:MAG: esterase-like activity of phytase family protein [Myxococcota bacterium]
MRAPRALALLPLLALVATGCPAQSSGPPPNETALHPGARVTPVRLADSDALTGTSGLDLRGPGEVWMAPERTGHLVALTLKGASLTQVRDRRIDGIPEGADVEALAFVPGTEGRVLLGTEAKGARAQDPILVATLEEERVHVTGALVFDYAPFGVVAEDNQGIEGLCAGEGFAVAASEAIVETSGRRFACVGRFDLPDGAMNPYRVRLASRRGKLSALTCRARDEGIEVFAIERHFGTMRLVRFLLGPEPDVSAELVKDLAPALGPEPPNVEGLAWLDDARLLLVTDNHYRVKTGPTRAFIVEL